MDTVQEHGNEALLVDRVDLFLVNIITFHEDALEPGQVLQVNGPFLAGPFSVQFDPDPEICPEIIIIPVLIGPAPVPHFPACTDGLFQIDRHVPAPPGQDGFDVKGQPEVPAQLPFIPPPGG